MPRRAAKQGVAILLEDANVRVVDIRFTYSKHDGVCSMCCRETTTGVRSDVRGAGLFHLICDVCVKSMASALESN